MGTIIHKIFACFSSILIKIPEMFSSIRGCIASAFLFIASFCAGYEAMICMVMFCIVTDAMWGIAVAVKRHKFVLSELGRNSIVKIAAYGNAIFILIGIEKVIGSDSHITTAIATTAICAAELWSISGNVLIIKPNFPFFKLFRPALKGEISRKLGVSEEKVDEILDNKQ